MPKLSPEEKAKLERKEKRAAARAERIAAREARKNMAAAKAEPAAKKTRMRRGSGAASATLVLTVDGAQYAIELGRIIPSNIELADEEADPADGDDDDVPAPKKSRRQDPDEDDDVPAPKKSRRQDPEEDDGFDD